MNKITHNDQKQKHNFRLIGMLAAIWSILLGLLITLMVFTGGATPDYSILLNMVLPLVIIVCFLGFLPFLPWHKWKKWQKWKPKLKQISILILGLFLLSVGVFMFAQYYSQESLYSLNNYTDGELVFKLFILPITGIGIIAKGLGKTQKITMVLSGVVMLFFGIHLFTELSNNQHENLLESLSYGAILTFSGIMVLSAGLELTEWIDPLMQKSGKIFAKTTHIITIVGIIVGLFWIARAIGPLWTMTIILFCILILLLIYFKNKIL
ncbi:hypothetical protein CVV38_04005 [Candidatus Peregrinibacteria bacterium HGW-Peregrinibacteria-1]|jgi:MFS family permease|nr:MAG: hypothetical protein CVV38_04005 [Candidatus Peregrinibacteria bacterium HGW-Peregrinibacteria-1]